MKKETAIWLTVIAVVAIGSWSIYALGWLDRNRDQPANQGGGANTTTGETPVATDGPGSQPSGVIAPVMGDAPSFELTDQMGESFGSEDLRGKVWIANFMFTQCTATCPLQSRELQLMQTGMSSSLIWSDIMLVSISVDPKHDTPEVLKDYAEGWDADHNQWKFLTGEGEKIWELSKDGFHLPVGDDPGNPDMPIAHDSKFVLVDRAGKIRGYYDVLTQEGATAFKRALSQVLPELPPTLVTKLSKGEPTLATHLAGPPEIISNAWLEEAEAKQRTAIKDSQVFHDFAFTNQVDASGIDYDPQIVDEQRWRMQVNHYDHGTGVAVADVDGDEKLDLFFVSQAGSNALYRALGDGKYEDITEKAGVAMTQKIGVAAAFGDIDNDGDADLFVTTVRSGNVLFRNDGKGVFEDVSKAAGVDYVGHSSSAVFFDYDHDGLLDLYVTNVGKYTTDNAESLRVDETSSLPPGDYKYYLGIPNAFAGHLHPELSETSILYHNEGGERFTDVTEQMGLVDTSWSGAATPLDVNEDRWQDLYVLNMQGHDQYFENVDGKRFERKSRDVFPRTPWGAMGVKSFDFDNDSKFDLYVTDMHSDMSQNVGPEKEKLKAETKLSETFLKTTLKESVFGNAFFKNLGDGKFEEVSDEIGAENYWPWGLSVGDLNGDGYADAFLASSMCFPYRYSANSVLLNDQGKRFVDSEFVVGVEPRPESERVKPWFSLDCDGDDKANSFCAGRTGRVIVWSALGSRSSVLLDIDGDGDLDIITSDFNSKPQVLVSNLSEKDAAPHYLQVSLLGSASNRNGLGAVVKVFVADDRTQTQANDGQSGYLAQSVMPLYFGLGVDKQVAKIEVAWPSGKTQTLEGPIDVDQTLKIVEKDE